MPTLPLSLLVEAASPPPPSAFIEMTEIQIEIQILLSFIRVAYMGVGVGPSTEHGQPTVCHTLKERFRPLLQDPSPASSMLGV